MPPMGIEMQQFIDFYETNPGRHSHRPLRCASFTESVIVTVTLLMLCGCLPANSNTYERTRAEASPTQLDDRINQVLDNVLRARQLSSDTHAAWQVLHGILAYGANFPLSTPEGTSSALDYLLKGGTLRGWTLEEGDQLPGGDVGLRAIVEPGGYFGQGHADQWLAILSQCNLSAEDTIAVQGKLYPLKSFVAQVQLDAPYNHDDEWSWTLIGLTQYLPTDSSWTAGDGRKWSIEDLVAREVSQEINSSTCGGTHRLIGMAMALERRRAEGKSLDGVWSRANQTLQQAVQLARQYQNADGSFSSNYFGRTGIAADNATLLSTTGHTLEFLALTLSPEELQEPWVQRAVARLCQLLEETDQFPLECGALYHAVHGLVIYRERTSQA